MEIIPVQPRRVQPPQDDLLAVLDESLPTLVEDDVVVVSGKVVAIHEGRCFSKGEYDKRKLAEDSADI